MSVERRQARWDDADYAFGRSRAEYQRLIEQGALLRSLADPMLVAAGITGGMQAQRRLRHRRCQLPFRTRFL
jgi:hypothetical protein